MTSAIQCNQNKVINSVPELILFFCNYPTDKRMNKNLIQLTLSFALIGETWSITLFFTHCISRAVNVDSSMVLVLLKWSIYCI